MGKQRLWNQKYLSFQKYVQNWIYQSFPLRINQPLVLNRKPNYASLKIWKSYRIKEKKIRGNRPFFVILRFYLESFEEEIWTKQPIKWWSSPVKRNRKKLKTMKMILIFQTKGQEEQRRVQETHSISPLAKYADLLTHHLSHREPGRVKRNKN